MGLLGTLVLSSSAFVWWRAHITTLLPHVLLAWIFGVAVFLHLFEAAIAARLAARAKLPVLPWTLQTVLLGYASLGPLRSLIALQKTSD